MAELRRRRGGSGSKNFRVLDAAVQQSCQNVEECVGDALQIAECEVAVIELSILDLVAEDGRDHLRELLPTRLFQASRRGFDRVPEHYESGFARLRLRPRVAEPGVMPAGISPEAVQSVSAW